MERLEVIEVTRTEEKIIVEMFGAGLKVGLSYPNSMELKEVVQIRKAIEYFYLVLESREVEEKRTQKPHKDKLNYRISPFGTFSMYEVLPNGDTGKLVYSSLTLE